MCKLSRTSLTSAWVKLVLTVSSPYKKLSASEHVPTHPWSRSTTNTSMKTSPTIPCKTLCSSGRTARSLKLDLKTEESTLWVLRDVLLSLTSLRVRLLLLLEISEQLNKLGKTPKTQPLPLRNEVNS